MKTKHRYRDYTIGSISLEIRTGKTPPSSEEVYYKDGTINWFTPSDIGNVSNLHNASKKITPAAIANRVAVHYKPDTVLITCIGEIGRVGIIRNSASANQQITGILVDETIINSKYFYYWLLRNQKLLKHYSNYAVIPILNNSTLEKIPISLPDLSVQNKAVAQLDLIQLLIDMRKEMVATVDQLVEATFFEMFGDPITNPNDIPTTTLGEIGVWQSGGTPRRSSSHYFEGDIPWFSSGELNEVFISDSKEKISKEALQNSSAKIIEPGSLLLGMYDTAALKSSICTITSSCNQAIAFSKLDSEKCDVLYVYYAIQLSKKLHLTQRLGARQQNLSNTAIKGLIIPLPTPDLQNEFANQVLKIFDYKNSLKSSLEVLESLFKSLMQDVFNEKDIIREEVLFDDLVNTFKKEDYLGDNKRLTYLIKALNEGAFSDFKSYESARKIAFEFLEEKVLEQSFNTQRKKIELQILN